MDVLREIVCVALFVYWLILIARIIVSWFRMPLYGPGRKALDILYDLTEPVLRPLRGMLPPVRMGMMALDLSPIIAFIIIGILRVSIC